MSLDKDRVAKIFERLRSGAFISANTPHKDEAKLYEYVERNYDELREYFSYIDIDLKLRDHYCYFSSLTNKEQKLGIILELIDLISFLFEIRPNFSVGDSFDMSSLIHTIKDDAIVMKKLNKIKSLNQETLEQKVSTLIAKLEKRGFIALKNEYLNEYVVLNSFEYIVEFFNKIEIKE